MAIDRDCEKSNLKSRPWIVIGRDEVSWVISRIMCDATATDCRTKSTGTQLQQICGSQKCFKTLTVMFRTSEDPNLDTKRMKKKTRILFLHVSFTEILYMHSLSLNFKK